MQVVIESLYKQYGKVEALRDVNLQIESGMFGLLGPNGAGKTTLMRILATLIPKSAGKVRIGPYDLDTEPHKVRELLGNLPQSFNTYRNFTAFEVLDYVAVLKGITDTKARRRAVDQVLEQVNLSRSAKARVGTFSGGMKQRLGIAQALLGNPKLLIVDEPTAGLDPEERIRFRNLLGDISRDRIVILSTHVVADIESVCSALAVLNRGRVVYTGTPEELARQAQGKVWSLTLPAGEVDRLRAVKILARRQTAEGVQIRCLADQAPSNAARQVAPSLEDGYMVTVGSGLEVVAS
ncbi:MAG: ABC transporter ATP-binding protein [Firmicutes bacterium]|nr:ABC transporter ATP-binding protein [Bacillota bacterium]